MKTFSYLVIFLMAFSVSAQEIKTEKSGKKVVTMKVLITGMTCAHGCAKGIEDHVYRIKGVKSSKVDFETMTGTFVFDESKVSKEQIMNAILTFNPGEANTPKYKAEEIAVK